MTRSPQGPFLSSAGLTELQQIAADAPPEGFSLRPAPGPFSEINGPYYMKREGERIRLGFRVGERHLNGFGICHGGMLMSFADTVCAVAVVTGTKHRAMTVRMTTDFLGAVNPGSWVEGHGHLTRATRSMAFVEADGLVGETPVFRVQALFKLLERHPAMS